VGEGEDGDDGVSPPQAREEARRTRANERLTDRA